MTGKDPFVFFLVSEGRVIVIGSLVTVTDFPSDLKKFPLFITQFGFAVVSSAPGRGTTGGGPGVRRGRWRWSRRWTGGRSRSVRRLSETVKPFSKGKLSRIDRKRFHSFFKVLDIIRLKRPVLKILYVSGTKS